MSSGCISISHLMVNDLMIIDLMINDLTINDKSNPRRQLPMKIKYEHSQRLAGIVPFGRVVKMTL